MDTFTTTVPTRSVVHIKKLQRASRQLDVIPSDPVHGLYVVESATQPGRCYEVRLDPEQLSGSCTCPWAQHGGINCKHVLAALRAHYAPHESISFWRNRSDARRQHRRIVVGTQLYATLRRSRRTFSSKHGS